VTLNGKEWWERSKRKGRRKPFWKHEHAGPHWRARHQHHPERLFLRFIVFFGLVVLLVLGGMGALAFLFTQLFGGDGQMAVLVWIAGCGLSLALPLLAAAVAARIFRDIAMPLADVMAAADAVAEGDLSARVPSPTRGPDEFGHLAESFNHMAAELERADEQRRNLTADVAHELRTPLHVIQGNLEGVLDGVYEPTDAHITATLDEARVLARLIEDLRTLSLAESGQLPLVKEPVDVAELLADVRTSFSGQAEAAGVDLNVVLDGDPAQLTLVADAGRLDQVLGNLVANALRHTPAGGNVTLSAEPVPGGMRITVRDTGEGIPAPDLPYVFDRFWRGDRSRSHAGGAGSGLGLSIARQLVQAHGGRIRVESDLGRGTTFTVELPAQ
jgi:signal transduction histidine kinase